MRAPDGWGALRYGLNDPQAYIPIQVGFHCLLPMMGYQDWTVHSMGCGIGFKVDLHRFAWHCVEWLVRADVERTGSIVVSDP